MLYFAKLLMEKDIKYLIEKLKAGDESVYIDLFRKYYVILCAYSRRYVGRKDIAEEIVSETFFNIWKNRKKLTIHSSIKSYLFQAVANNSMYFLRKMSKEKKLEDYFSGTTSENIGFKEISDDLADKSLLMEELSVRIEHAVSQLPKQQQRAFRLKRFDRRKNKEIAEIMGISEKTVEMHLTKAMLSLQKKLRDFLPTFLFYMLLK
jgi:RNA polymerase sigma-70 factor (ECF subfamily)